MDVDDLYGLPLEQFVSQRTALSRELRAQGRRERAAEVSRLRKPSVAAWAVNQLVRTQGKAVSELFGAGDELREAHERAVSGSGDAASLRAAAERERAAVDALVGAARGLLSADGHELSPAIIDRVAETLHAAALEDQAREQVRDGRLERELRHVGLGELSAGVMSAPAPGRGPAPARATAPEPAIPERAEPGRAARERIKAREAARTAEAAARRRAARAERAVQAAEERRERAAQVLRDADEALAAARAEAEEAEAEHRAAEARLEEF